MNFRVIQKYDISGETKNALDYIKRDKASSRFVFNL